MTEGRAAVPQAPPTYTGYYLLSDSLSVSPIPPCRPPAVPLPVPEVECQGGYRRDSLATPRVRVCRHHQLEAWSERVTAAATEIETAAGLAVASGTGEDGTAYVAIVDDEGRTLVHLSEPGDGAYGWSSTKAGGRVESKRSD